MPNEILDATDEQAAFDAIGFEGDDAVDESEPFAVYIASESNRMLGGWVLLPADPDDLDAAIDAVSYNGKYDWTVADTSALTSHANDFAMYNVSLERLNELAEEWSGRSEDDWKIASWLDDNGYKADFEDAMANTGEVTVGDFWDMVNMFRDELFSYDQLHQAFDHDYALQEFAASSEDAEADVEWAVDLAEQEQDSEFFKRYSTGESIMAAADYYGYDVTQVGASEYYYYSGN